MESEKLKDTSELPLKLNLNNFPLVNHYLNYDECYMDNSWIKYTVYFEGGEHVAVIAERLPEQEIGHILILEVNKNMLGKGIGRKVMTDYMKGKPYWELWSVEAAEGFYEKLGFKMSKKSELFFWGFKD